MAASEAAPAAAAAAPAEEARAVAAASEWEGQQVPSAANGDGASGGAPGEAAAGRAGEAPGEPGMELLMLELTQQLQVAEDSLDAAYSQLQHKQVRGATALLPLASLASFCPAGHCHTGSSSATCTQRVARRRAAHRQQAQPPQFGHIAPCFAHGDRW